MKRFPLYITVLLSLVCAVLFTGQRRPATRPVAPPKPVQKQIQQPTPQELPIPERPSTETNSTVPLLYMLPNDVPFPPPSGDRPRTATILGDPKAAGLYVTRTMIPKGKQIIPHTHSDSRTVIVLTGTYYYGVGETFDEKKMVALPPGSFYTEPAGVPHYTWSKDGDVIIQTTANGPSGTQIVPDKPAEENTPIPDQP